MDFSSTLPPQVTLVVPVYNEEPSNLRLLLERVALVLEPALIFYEVLFVDDGSKAKTHDALKELADEFDYVRVIVLSRNFGEIPAICAGLAHSRGEAVINMDSDLQDPPELIPTMLQYWREGYDVVFTRQASRKESVPRQFLAFAFYRLLGAFSSVKIPVDAGEFRLLSRRAVNAVCATPEKAKFLRGLIPWIGFKNTIIPFDRDERKFGDSSYTTSKLLQLAVDGLVAFNMQPLYFIPVLGCVILAGGCLGLIFSAFSPQIILGMQLSLVSLLLAVAGAQVACTGVLAVYLAEVLKETRARPTYIVAEEFGKNVVKADHSLNSDGAINSELSR
ncbi:MAG: glycosyltransferase family 2 protein [Cyanobacteria bacterium SZAS-4]|nr:glycosyltransferase family 2 protein [Cyanobacteria bacterium SZAS-4]